MYEDTLDRSDLLFKLKLLKDKVAAFETGEKYIQMKNEFKIVRESDLRYIRSLELEIEQLHSEIHRVRDIWYDTCEDIYKEHEKEINALKKDYERVLKDKDREIASLRKELLKADIRNENDHSKLSECRQEMYDAKTQLEEEKEKNAALNARLNKDYSNSSKSSSMSPNHKTIQNSREKTGRTPGAQAGHEHHGRKDQKATKVIKIQTPDKYVNNPEYKPTGKYVTKKLIIVRLVTEVIEYQAEEFRNVNTGQRVHGDFPAGVVDDINYDGSIKALAYMINNELYTSVDKTREFLKTVSHGKIDISNGFICGLSKKFSKITAKEREEIFTELMASDVLHSDFTFGRVSGKQGTVIINVNENGKVLYQGRKKKGDEGVKDSPLEYYDGTLVSDHEAAIIKHGKRHQECLAHLERYARGSEENEPGKTWGRKLINWIKENVKWWHKVNEGEEKYTLKEAEKRIKNLQEIIALAESEYEYEPPSDYYLDGYNTFKRIKDDFEDYVLFLRDITVPPTNNIAERMGRKFKRKAHQVMSFRSMSGLEYFCDGLSIMESIKGTENNLFDEIVNRFNHNESMVYLETD